MESPCGEEEFQVIILGGQLSRGQISRALKAWPRSLDFVILTMCTNSSSHSACIYRDDFLLDPTPVSG